MPCSTIDSRLVLQMMTSAHCTMTMAVKKWCGQNDYLIVFLFFSVFFLFNRYR